MQERDITVESARDSEEIFLTNSLIGVWPVCRWDDTKYKVQGTTTAKIISYINEKFNL